MTTSPTPAIDRIPLAHSVRYVARGLPEVPNQYGPGVLAPSEITLTYRSASDSGLGRVHAYVAGRIWVDGTELPLLPGGLYGQHYDEGLSNWPEWLAEEARLHDPASAPAVPAGRDALRDRIAEEAYRLALSTALRLGTGANWEAIRDRAEDLVAEATELTEARRRQQPTADRAAVLREGEAALREKAGQLSELAEETMRRDLEEIAQVWHEAASALAQLATEQPAVVAAVAGEEPDTETGAPFSSRVARLVAEDARALRMDLYDDLAAYARQTGNTGLQQAQIRDHLSEFLLEGLLRRTVAGDRLRCPRCRTDITDYAEDDHVFRTGDERPYCSGECVVAAHRAAASQPGKEEA